MGRLKEMAMEYNCDIEYASESQLLNVFVRGIIDHTSAKENQEMQEFYEQVLPDSNGESRYWLFVQDETQTITNLHFKSKKEYIETIIKLSEFETFNVFYSLANYKDGHNNKNVISLKCAAVDIDDIDFDVSTKSKEELVDYIKREYALSDDELPNYLIMSGHGLHLYYLLDETIDRETFETYQEHLTTFYLSDRACIPGSHYWRAPGGYNVKGIPVKTRIYKLNDNKDISRLEYFRMTEEQIETYRTECNRKRYEKTMKTREKNGTLSKKKTANKPQKQQNKQRPETCVAEKFPEEIEAEERQEQKKDMQEKSSAYERIPIENFVPYADFRKGETSWNLIKDLHNYFINHGGDIQGKREIFVFLIANYSQSFMTAERCKHFCSKYFTSDFIDEMESTVDRIYEKGTFYDYNFLNIADLLAFTEEDVEKSYCNFSIERRKQANNRRVQEHRERKRAERKAEKDKTRIFIEENINLTAESLAEECGISVRSVYRIKAEIRSKA